MSLTNPGCDSPPPPPNGPPPPPRLWITSLNLPTSFFNPVFSSSNAPSLPSRTSSFSFFLVRKAEAASRFLSLRLALGSPVPPPPAPLACGLVDERECVLEGERFFFDLEVEEGGEGG